MQPTPASQATAIADKKRVESQLALREQAFEEARLRARAPLPSLRHCGDGQYPLRPAFQENLRVKDSWDAWKAKYSGKVEESPRAMACNCRVCCDDYGEKCRTTLPNVQRVSFKDRFDLLHGFVLSQCLRNGPSEEVRPTLRLR